jgi:hypothetical protein
MIFFRKILIGERNANPATIPEQSMWRQKGKGGFSLLKVKMRKSVRTPV